MKKNYLAKLNGLALLFALITANLSGQITQTFSYTGSMQSFTVPSCVSQITLDVRGAQGANALDKLVTNSTGGLGGRAQGVLAVTPGQVLNIFVGGAGNTNGNGGYNGGGGGGSSTAGGGCNGGPAGGGGGASDIRLNGTALANRIVVAGGGGGAGRDYCNGSCVPCGCGGSGGAGGGLTGNNGIAANNCGFSYPGSGVNFGSGGSASAGGNGGTGDGGGPSGTAGTTGVGGVGGSGSYDVAGGGGGGGYYGGGGGGSASSGSGVGGGGGGGGSAYLGSLINAASSSSFQANDGLVVISYQYNGGVVSASANSTLICLGSNVNLVANGTVLSYTWSTGSNNASISVVPTTNTTYTVSSTNSLNCISVSTIAIVVNTAQPVLSVTSSTNQTCLGKTATLTATGAVTYTWTNGVTNGVSFNPTVTTTYVVSGQNACGTVTSAITITVAPLPVTILSNSTTVCAGTAVTFTTLTPGTSFTWQPTLIGGTLVTASPIVNTTYSLTVSDGTCTGNGVISLTAIPVPTVTASVSNSNVCAGTPVNLNASGGISYSWSPVGQTGSAITVTPTSPTAYVVTAMNAQGCSTSTSVVVVTMSSPTVNITTSSYFVCPGDPVSLSAATANSYLWGDGSTTSSIAINPTLSAVYSVTGTTSGCSSTQTIEIDVFTSSLSVTGQTAICNGASANITASGADTYSWDNGSPFAGITVTPSVTTIYTVSAQTNTGSITCPSTATFQVVVKPTPTVTAVPSRSVICKGETVTVTASGAGNYQWTNSSSTASAITITSSLVTTINLTVTGTAANSCTASAVAKIQVNPCTGIDQLSNPGAAITIYPNPSAGEFYVEYHSAIELALVNQLGQVVKVITLNEGNNFKAHVSGLSNGIYFITGQINGQNFERKIIVNK